MKVNVRGGVVLPTAILFVLVVFCGFGYHLHMAYAFVEDRRNYDKKWKKTAKGKLYVKRKRARWLKRKGAKEILARAAHKYNVSEKGRANRKRWRDKAKADCIAAYGGKCACCGEHRPEFMTADHVDGGGRKHRQSINSISFWYWLRKNGFPKDKYRLLCMNCNMSLGRLGYCPHDREREALAVSSPAA